MDTYLCSTVVHREHSQIWAPTTVSGCAHEAKRKGTSQVEKVSGKRVWVNRYSPAAQCCISCELILLSAESMLSLCTFIALSIACTTI